MDWINNHFIDLMMLFSGILTAIGVMRYQAGNTEKKIDKMAEKMEIRDNKMDTRMENMQNTLHAVQLEQTRMNANIDNIKEEVKEIKRRDEKIS